MPTYEYQCDDCEYAFETLQSMTDKKLTKCPECGEEKLTRLIGSGSGIIFKGTGFYQTDYKKSSSGDQSKKDSTETTTEKKSETNSSKNEQKVADDKS